MTLQHSLAPMVLRPLANALLLSLSLAVFPATAADYLVRDAAAYANATRALAPGDTVILADGVWRDMDLLFQGTGKIGQPIRLTAQTPGKVILSGQSQLRLAGEHLEVSNLVFRDGWAPGGEVVSFRRSASEWANHSRVTGIVIDRYNKPDRQQSDHWVALYGHHNRFDHNQLVGKTNAGTTLVVVRNATSGLDNQHRIDHNWFGPRPNLGSNGGETMRIGTSHDSQSDSRTVVEKNWFEQCDGEVEIVSNKSGGNIYRGNVFQDSRGSLVLRHGHGNRVERNVFLGHGKAHTGGVRVINRHQTVRDNYFEGIAGDNFAAALSVMAGTHDAPLNRYEQIDHAVIERNSFIQVGTVLLGAGLDEERNAMPVNSRIAGNLFIGDGKRELLRAQGDLSGITFAGNVQSPAVSPGFPGGVSGQSLTLQRAPNGLLYPTAAIDAGAPRDLAPIARDQVGVDWYPKTLTTTALDSGAVRTVAPGEDTLTAAVAASAPGDRLQLQRGRYTVSQVLAVDHPLSVAGPARGQASVQFSRPSLFEISAGGSLRLARLDIDGALAPDAAGNAVIRVPPGSQAFNYTLLLEDSHVHGLTANKAFDVIATGKGSLAARIALSNVTVEDITGSVIAAAAETDDLGTYNAEQVDLLDSRFRRIGGPVLNLYRGGTDESTFGPALQVHGNQFEQVGVADDTSLRLHGVQFASIRDNRFDRSGRIRFSHRVGEPTLRMGDNPLTATAPLLSDTPVEALP
ncbi:MULTISPECIES: polysaccharide lyase 6 family protein [Stenotrophomonas]|uniref:polysaccharide lyase 6 family protein n=1 Tax=Stenotrophomonas TaxID=40323 RepID=UPI0024DEF83E|nr:polysaccharide lyase 6 family protein [Stenotrophomonas sp. BIO128-Bstrain]WIA60904.1 polysaccharide lyase 6 family protein [Stenotrophomonas sp. BIO128-Bstrain]